MRFSLSHILAPRQSPAEFFAMARALGVTDVEIRNDTPNVVGTLAPADVKAAAATAGVNLLSINALYPFNVWNDERRAQTEKLADYAAASGAKALVMCPLNDGTPVSQADVVTDRKSTRLNSSHSQISLFLSFFFNDPAPPEISPLPPPAAPPIYAAASGAKALVMCPLNDGTPVSQADVV